MKDRVSVSPLLKHLTCHLIPFGIDINMFFPEMDYGPTECAHTVMLHHILDTFVARNRS